jgi:pyrimidine-nucleoside phosphorylase
MLVLGKRTDSLEHAREMLLSALRTGSGLSRLKVMIAAQGGNPDCVTDVNKLPQPALIREVKVGREGYIAAMDTEALGYAAQAMGAGRVQKTDVIDYSVGYILPVRIGDHVTADATLCTLYARNEADAQKAEAAIRAAITIGDAPVEHPPLWYAVVTADGVERFA